MYLCGGWKGVCFGVLLLAIKCKESVGASLEKNAEKATETIVAVAGVSPALLNTAISLFDPIHGKNLNQWNFAGNLMLPERDKFFQFQAVEAPIPLRPLFPAGLVSKPMTQLPQQGNQQPLEEQDKSSNVGPASLPPLQPVQPLEAVDPVQVQSEPVVLDPEVISAEEQKGNVESPKVQEVEVMAVSPSAPVQSTTSGNGYTQGSQGGQHAAGNQVVHMILHGNGVEFASTADVNMNVVSDGGSTSNIHYFGTRAEFSKPPHSQYHHHHQGQPNSNGVTAYSIKF